METTGQHRRGGGSLSSGGLRVGRGDVIRLATLLTTLLEEIEYQDAVIIFPYGVHSSRIH